MSKGPNSSPTISIDTPVLFVFDYIHTYTRLHKWFGGRAGMRARAIMGSRCGELGTIALYYIPAQLSSQMRWRFNVVQLGFLPTVLMGNYASEGFREPCGLSKSLSGVY